VVDLKGQLPSLGAAVIGKSTTPAGSAIKVSETTLENKFFKILLDSNAEIESIIDKRTGREVIDQSSEFKGNALQLFEDRPRNWDAWDIDVAYQDKLYPLQDVKSVKVVEDGPIRAGIEIERTVKEGLGSTVKQRIYIYSDLARIDFETVVDWKERETLLKAAFPVTIHSELATYDIQFGNVQRPTHWNTSWDWARFEVCGHKWADLSEGDYGVSLLSDSKYGWDTKDNTMRLTLLKGAVYPDPTADIGIHKFTYSLLPHEGDWRAAETVRRAYELNAPVHFGKTKGGSGSLGASFSFVSVDRPNIILETIKIGEYDDNIVVRAHEVYNQRGTATLTFDRPVQSAKAVNLVEEKGDGVEPVVHGSTISFEYGPYEIRTFKIAF
jgi:alpha-mannosidase